MVGVGLYWMTRSIWREPVLSIKIEGTQTQVLFKNSSSSRCSYKGRNASQILKSTPYTFSFIWYMNEVSVSVMRRGLRTHTHTYKHHWMCVTHTQEKSQTPRKAPLQQPLTSLVTGSRCHINSSWLLRFCTPNTHPTWRAYFPHPAYPLHWHSLRPPSPLYTFNIRLD